MTYEAAMTQVLARSEIQIKTDNAGRPFAQYYSRRAGRWIRVAMADAQIALAAQA